jgi:hypothetical protein
MGLAGTVLQARLLYADTPTLSIAKPILCMGKSPGKCLCDIYRRQNCCLGLSEGQDAAIADLTDFVIAYLTAITVDQAGSFVSGSARKRTITIAGQTFSIKQEGF